MQREMQSTTTTQDLMDRSIVMTCTPTLVWHADGKVEATAVFEQDSVDPSSMGNRVSLNGDIRLKNMPANSNYNDNVDITILLDTSELIDEGGMQLEARWAKDGEGPNNEGACWFCRMIDVKKRTYDPDPITIPNMKAIRLGDTKVMIDDDTPDDAPDYAFCLGLWVNGEIGFIRIDPVLGSKGGGGGPEFMLKE